MILHLQQDVGRGHARGSGGEDRRAAPGDRGRAEESRGTGHFPGRAGHLRKAGQGVYGEAVGAFLQRPALLHHQAPAGAADV